MKKLKLSDIAVVIPTYRRIALALRLARYINSHHPQVEIIIVEQARNRSMKPKIPSYIRYFYLNEANLSRARNVGLEQSRGEVIVYLDDDVEITPATIPSHLRAYKNTKVMGVSGRLICKGDPFPKSPSIETGKTNFLGTRFIFSFFTEKKQFIDFPAGGNMSFRASAIKKIGGFDERFIKAFDEIDLAKRFNKRYPRSMLFEPKALVFHHKAKNGGARTQSKVKQKQMMYRHYGMYLAKHVPFPFSLVSLAIRSRSVLKEEKSALKYFIGSYIHYLLKKIHQTILSYSTFVTRNAQRVTFESSH